MDHFYTRLSIRISQSLATIGMACRAKINFPAGLWLLLLLLLFSDTLLAQDWSQIIKTAASDRRTLTTAGRGFRDFFGYSVAIDGDYAVVGAYGESNDPSGENSFMKAGTAIVFKRVNGNWTQIKRLVANDRAIGDEFAISVAISGSLIVVGADTEDQDASGGNPLTDAGSAYIFSQNEGGTDNWGQIKKLVATDRTAGDIFGYSVAISGSLIVVGAYQDDEDASGGNPLTDAGSAYIFSQNEGGTNNWGQVKKLTANDRAADDRFGISVGISGSLVVVGAPQEDEDASGTNTVPSAGSAYVFGKDQGGANNWGQVKKIVASDRTSGNLFGWSVAISGDQIFAGAYRDNKDESGINLITDAGSAYVFGKDQGGADNWGQAQKVVLSNYMGNQYYGYSVAVEGDYAVIGASQDYLDASSGQVLLGAGSAYVLKRQNGTWTQIKKLVASDRGANDRFGWSVAISGSQIVVGAPQEDEDVSGVNSLTSAGSVYVFSQNQGGTDNWGQVKKLVASDRAAGDQFGWSVAISGSQLVVGASQEAEDASGSNTLLGSGSAYVFYQNQGGTGNWGQVKKIVASDRAAGDQFGVAVGISGNLIVVGAYGEDEDASGGSTVGGAGSAYVFSQNQGGTDNWGQVKKIVANDRGINDFFGAFVAINGSLIVVGAFGKYELLNNQLLATGAAYVFSQNQGGTDNWGQVKKLVASDRSDHDNFGASVAISGSTIVVGAFGENLDALGSNSLADAGAAFVFSQNEGGANNWGQVEKIVASDRAAGDYFGYSVGVSGSQLVVGAYRDEEDALGTNPLASAGSAYFFEFTGITLTGFAASPATVCAGSVTSFSASFGNLTGSYSFTLTNGTSSTSGTGTNPTLTQSLTATGSGTQSFSLIVSASGSTALSTIALTVNASPTASILKPASSTLTCTTTSLSLTATGGGTYLWDNSTTNAVRTLTTAGTYSVKVTGANSCTAAATTTITSNTLLALSTDVNLPQANVGVVVSLTASGATTYQWIAPPTVLLTSPTTASALSVSLTTAGEQSFTLVASAGVCSQSALVSVTALAGPDLSAILLLPSGGFSAGETKGVLMQLQEVNGSAASGAIVITVTVPTGYSVSFDNTLTSIQVSGGNLVNVANGKWMLSSQVGSQQLRISLNGGESVGARSPMNVGFWVSRTSANGGSSSNITVNVADDSSGSYDVNRLNNVYARIITGQ